MSEPIKLTDEVLRFVDVFEDGDTEPGFTPEQLATAIRTLRDRARAVVDARIATRGQAAVMPLELGVALDALREVLP